VAYEAVEAFSHPTTFFQLWAYDECIARHRREHRWMAFIDADEFLQLRDASVPNLPALLSQYEDEAGLAVNWQVGAAARAFLRSSSWRTE
jgi:hypothetical protein